MVSSFLKYFFRHGFLAKRRQGSLVLVMLGPFLSALALLLIQSVMGGLQKSLVGRMQYVEGPASIEIYSPQLQEKEQLLDLWQELKNLPHLRKAPFQLIPLFEMEVMVENRGVMLPAVVKGLDPKYGGLIPVLAKEWTGETLVGLDLARQLKLSQHYNQITIISPSDSQALVGESPRSITTSAGGVIDSQIPEVDAVTLWTRLGVTNNLQGEMRLNRIEIHQASSSETTSQNNISHSQKNLIFKEIRDFLKNHPLIKGVGAELKTWEEKNEALVWALNLESTVMVFLFLSMSFLVATAIMSGQIIFFEGLKRDLVSFWILGATLKDIRNSAQIFIHVLSVMTVLSGIALGFLILFLLDYFGPNLLPDIFVDRKLPVDITLKGVGISFIVPYATCVGFSFYSLRNFRKHTKTKNFLGYLRSVGR
jgi:lipoprotein-releasing system permease protein